MGGYGLFSEGENGPITIAINQESDRISTGMYGHVGESQANASASITLTPTDNWNNLGLLFPAYLGGSVGALPGALEIGKRPHGTVNVPAVVWTPDGRLYTFPRSAVVRPPSLHLGVGKALFGEMEIIAIGDATKNLGEAGFLYTLVESAGVDPGGEFSMDDFIRGRWTGVWGDGTGATAGFGGGAGGVPVEAEDEWTIETEVKFSPLTVQKLVRGYKLDSVRFMARVRPYGPTHTQINTATGINSSRTLGSRFGTTSDLVLTGPGAKTITLKNADVKGAGFDFGGTKLGTGEIGFVNEMKFVTGNPQPLIAFSA